MRFDFAFDDPAVRPASLLFGVTPRTADVEVDDLHLTIRFGPWRLVTPVGNVTATDITGPYRWWKIAGPPHLSFADRGVTFATSRTAGVCLRFAEPVPALAPTRLLRHPAATVTVADPAALVQSFSSTMTSR